MSLSEKTEESTLGHSTSDLEAEPQDIEKQENNDQDLTKGSAFPEGGLQAWLTLFGAFLMQFSTFGYTNAFGVYQDYYVREYLSTYTPSDIGWIGGTQIFLIFGCGIFAGRMFDKGYFHHLMISGGLLHSFSFFMLSLSKQNQYYQVFLSQGLGGGLASGIVFIPSVSVVSHFFQKNRPFAMGVVACGVALGAVTHPILLNQLFHGPIGFHNGVRISAALNAVLMLVANLIMRTRLPPSNQGDSVKFIEFVKDLPYMAIATGSFLVVCGIFFPSFFLQLDAIEHGVNSELAFYFLPILNGASIFGRVIPTYYAPRVGALNMLTFFTFCMGILLFCMVRIRDAVGFGVFAAIFGFVSGAAISLTPPVLAGMARNIGELGARIGFSFAITGIIGLFATPIAGALLTPKFLWWRAITFCGATMLAGGVSLLIARSSLVRKRRTRIV